MAQSKAKTTVTRKQVPVTQFLGAGTNLEETTVESVLKITLVNFAIAVRLKITRLIQNAKVCSYYLFLVPSRFQI